MVVRGGSPDVGNWHLREDPASGKDVSWSTLSRHKHNAIDLLGARSVILTVIGTPTLASGPGLAESMEAPSGTTDAFSHGFRADGAR